jgi:hypothetical protein
MEENRVIFVCTDFEGFWPVGTAAVVIADSEQQAREKLMAELLSVGLPQIKGFTLREIQHGVHILNDGNY